MTIEDETVDLSSAPDHIKKNLPKKRDKNESEISSESNPENTKTNNEIKCLKKRK